MLKRIFMSHEMLEGKVIEGKYHLERLLGAGGFGGVFLAYDKAGDEILRQVALKVISHSAKNNTPEAKTEAEKARKTALQELRTSLKLVRFGGRGSFYRGWR